MTRPEIEALLEGLYAPDPETWEAVIARVSEAIPQATERKTAKLVEAWAVVDKDGTISLEVLNWIQRAPEQWIELFNNTDPDRAPHRVARVVISEKE